MVPAPYSPKPAGVTRSTDRRPAPDISPGARRPEISQAPGGAATDGGNGLLFLILGSAAGAAAAGATYYRRAHATN